MTEADQEESDDTGTGEEDRKRSSIGLWMAVSGLGVATFAAGLLVGVISDGNAAILQDFKAKNACVTPVVDKLPANVVENDGAKASPATNASRPANGRIEWTVPVEKGTDVVAVEARNADPDMDARIEFGDVYTGQSHPVATLWVSAGSVARISLPEGEYAMRTTAYPVMDPTPGPQNDVVGTIRLRTDDAKRTPVLTADRQGVWTIAVRSEAAPSEQVAVRRAAPSHAEYDNLGNDARTGGSSTYISGH